MVNPYFSGPPNDHFDGQRFFNPGHETTDRDLRDLLRWKFKEKAAVWQRSVPVQQTKPDATVSGLRATVIGHASLLIQAGGLNVLTDPIWSKRASPLPFVGPRRVAMPGIVFDALPRIDAVLISHNHYDHMDVATLRRLHQAHAPLMVTTLGNDTILRRAIPGVRVLARDWWDSVDIGKGGTVTIVPAYHWSARSGRDRRMALWCGFMLCTAGGCAHFAGDTGYGDGHIFREVRRRIGRPDLALIPIGAYAPRWFMQAQHTDPHEAVQILEDLEASRGVGIHWGVFQLTDERRDEPPELLLESLARRGIAPDRFPAGIPGLSYEP
ncbi:MAG TPA: MBL fold metallo-hydrolase [Steroidobacteraceae bacterium]|jgi:L-ascorbate metabolism protein UlaG (beta-lactamase superfamily)|nr:MBL fold metallo-hydrolase [Steroidobacteraceae bacterium]